MTPEQIQTAGIEELAAQLPHGAVNPHVVKVVETLARWAGTNAGPCVLIDALEGVLTDAYREAMRLHLDRRELAQRMRTATNMADVAMHIEREAARAELAGTGIGHGFNAQRQEIKS